MGRVAKILTQVKVQVTRKNYYSSKVTILKITQVKVKMYAMIKLLKQLGTKYFVSDYIPFMKLILILS